MASPFSDTPPEYSSPFSSPPAPIIGSLPTDQSPPPMGSPPQLLLPVPSLSPPLHQSTSVPIRLIVGTVGAVIGSLLTAASIWFVSWIRGRRRGRSYSRHISEGQNTASNFKNAARLKEKAKDLTSAT